MATQEEIRAKVAPDATKCLAFLRNLARDPQGVPVQIQVAWDREADAPEITALEHVWWFDYEWLDSPVETE